MAMMAGKAMELKKLKSEMLAFIKKTFQASIWLIFGHFKLKLHVKIQYALNPTPAPFKHLYFATVWGLAMQPAKNWYA